MLVTGKILERGIFMATLTINNELNGIEISFDAKPLQAVIDTLKSNGFRWHRVKKIWYAKNTSERLQIAESIADGKKIDTAVPKKKEQQNIFGVKVGDIFSASWGYEQTNNDFFQVIALVGKQSVRVREVIPQIITHEAVSGMAEDRVYKITNEILPPASHSVFIKDQENGDLKRLKAGYYKDEEEAKKHCHFNLSSFADAYKCNGEEVKVYESWYY